MVKRFLWILMVPAVALTAILLAAGGAVNGGQHTETTGNNLSLPVIWGESAKLPLQGDPQYPVFDGEFIQQDGVNWYVQKDPDNLWQAETSSAGSELIVTWVDWGDNLESQDWRTTSKVRVETVLIKRLVDYAKTTMQGFTMAWLSGSGTTEVWGTNKATYASDVATIYSEHARLTIQRINPTLKTSLGWVPSSGEWVDVDGGEAVLSTDFNGGCWEHVDGPGGYSAEINVSGKAIYGYNWDVRTTSGGIAGTYRITFSLDALNPTETVFTKIDASTQIMTSEPEGEATILLAEGTKGGGGGKGGGIPSGGGKPVIDPINNLTYIDVTIKAGRR